jgi:putative ABC transport system substrate-binding protein
MHRRRFIASLAAVTTAAPTLHAEQKAMPAIGFLSGGSPGPSAANTATFLSGLSQAGYVEGQNVTIEYRWAEGHPDRAPLLAADLVRRQVNVIVAIGDASALAAKNATSTIPVVFFSGGDPVALRLVADFARPGGNLTGFGVMLAELMQKRVELLSELAPQVRMTGLLVNPADPNAERFIRDIQIAAHAIGLQVDIVRQAPTARSIVFLPPLANRASARSSSVRARFSSTAGSKSWRWHPVTRFRRSIRTLSSQRSAA